MIQLSRFHESRVIILYFTQMQCIVALPLTEICLMNLFLICFSCY